MMFLSLVVAVASTGCGDSDNDFVVNGGGGRNNLANQGIRVQMSAAELANLFPPATTQAVVDPSIVTFYVFAYDAAGNLVAQANTPNNGLGLDLLLTGLQLANFDVVLAGVDASGNLVGAYEAENITPVPNGLRVIGDEVFNALEGFVLPTNLNPPNGNISIDVEVNEVEGQYEVSFDGGNARSVSAVPVELVNAISADPTNTELQARFLTEALTITGTTGDPLTSPVVLTTEQSISGVVINQSFAGFTGVTYRVTVDRSNGDTGFVDTVLTAR